MRFSTIASFLVAAVLAGIAVFGARNWFASERQNFATQLQQQVQQVDRTPERTIVVASESISFGERLDKTKVREIEWPSSIVPKGSFEKVEDLIIGDTEDAARFALTNIAAGEPILNTKVTIPGQRAKLSTALTPGMKAVSIRVNDVLGVAGFVLPGDRVDILLTRGGRGVDSYVDVLLQGVKVLAIDQTADDSKDQPSVVRTVTFEVNTIEAQKLVLGANVGTLSLALRNLTSTGIEMNERITLNDLNDIDIAEDLIPEEPEVKVIVPDPSIARFTMLEQLLKNLYAGTAEQIQSLEDKLNAQEPVIVEREVIVERFVERKPVIPKRRTVAVIRNGKRAEYKVEEGNARILQAGVQVEPDG
ncbi:MAG: Flp pilus assembly protein CpaB [Rhodobacteraceae bacterium]|nr:MAG: Flp pilus assembly protein CpaB [Paracoccaceae bacterium]